MAHRRTSTLSAMMWTVLLTGALAEIGHLDHMARAPRGGQFDYYNPQRTVPRAEIVLPHQSAVNGADIDNPEQRAQYDAEQRKSVVELQPFRRTETAAVQSDTRRGKATLVNLNPNVNSWLLFTLDWEGPGGHRSYHIENPDPAGQHIHLVEGQAGLVVTTATASGPCDLWSGKPNALERGVATALPYAPLCGGKLYLRNRVAGHFTDLESMTDFLRENVWQGDDIVGFVRENLYQDAYRETGDTSQSTTEAPPLPDAPPTAELSERAASLSISARGFGIDVEGAPSHRLALGHWYPVRALPGVYASLMQAQGVSPTLVAADKGTINALDAEEASAVTSLVAFDLSQFEMRYALGTDHPRLGWSPRSASRTNLPGPDGIDNAAPLVTNGMVNPALIPPMIATFAGGFKREHGAFKWGDLAQTHHGSHYGFVEEGTILSKLQPGLATLYTLDDGSVHMETWSEAHNKLLAYVQSARQNGLPLVELGPKGTPVPGRFVRNWGAGNWSGSADAKLRTLRAGVCLIQSGAKPYLVHAVFSSATPSSMALVFQAYGCSYGMLLDMNAPVHGYLALYARQGDKLVVEHPLNAMTEIDRMGSGKLVPRFVGYPDNRDFFYLIRRKSSP